MSILDSIKSTVSAYGYIAGWKVVARLPEGMVHAIARKVADKATTDKEGRVGAGPVQLRKNLARVLRCQPEDVPDSLVRESMRRYLRYWVEAFRLPRVAGPYMAERAAAHGIGLDQAYAAHASGKGLVLVLPHMGNWDMAGMWLAEEVAQFTTVAERLKPESLYDAFVEFRESLGFRILPHIGGQPPFDELKRVLTDGGIVCLLGDRDMSARGVEVDFFGEKTTMPAGPALLARETGATLHSVGLWFTPPSAIDTYGGWGMKIGEQIPTQGRELPAIVQDIATCMEEDIAAHPADWHMLQPLWMADRKRRRKDR